MEPEEALSFISSEEYLRSQADYYSSVMRETGDSMEGKRILEVGAGYGFFLVYGIVKLGWDLYGIEPGKGEFSGRFEIAQQILNENGVDQRKLINSTGEDIRFESNSFDVVISNDVLEHVSDPQKVLQEACRVLTPGGILIFSMPNYRWLYEGHYNMLWLPFISKPIAKKYVKLRGRDSSYIDHLNFLTPWEIKKMVKNIPGAKICLPLGYLSAKFMLERVRTYIGCTENRSKRETGEYILRVLYAMASAEPSKWLMGLLASLTGIHHHIHLVAVKK